MTWKMPEREPQSPSTFATAQGYVLPVDGPPRPDPSTGRNVVPVRGQYIDMVTLDNMSRAEIERRWGSIIISIDGARPGQYQTYTTDNTSNPKFSIPQSGQVLLGTGTWANTSQTIHPLKDNTQYDNMGRLIAHPIEDILDCNRQYINTNNEPMVAAYDLLREEMHVGLLTALSMATKPYSNDKTIVETIISQPLGIHRIINVVCYKESGDLVVTSKSIFLLYNENERIYDF